MIFHVVGLGEVLWDLLPEGPQLGGAPANFAHHAHALGARATVVTRVGNDAWGRQIVARLQAAVQIDKILHGWPLAKIHQHAAVLARYVCSCAGATPDLPLTLRTPFLPS